MTHAKKMKKKKQNKKGTSNTDSLSSQSHFLLSAPLWCFPFKRFPSSHLRARVLSSCALKKRVQSNRRSTSRRLYSATWRFADLQLHYGWTLTKKKKRKKKAEMRRSTYVFSNPPPTATTPPPTSPLTLWSEFTKLNYNPQTRCAAKKHKTKKILGFDSLAQKAACDG